MLKPVDSNNVLLTDASQVVPRVHGQAAASGVARRTTTHAQMIAAGSVSPMRMLCELAPHIYIHVSISHCWPSQLGF